MPELPEVETIVRDLNKFNVVGIRIQTCKAMWSKTVCNLSPHYIKTCLHNKKTRSISRRGKFIVFTLEDHSQLLIHLRMSGRIHINNNKDKRDPHDRAVISLSNGYDIRLHDTRKFARIYIGKKTKGILEKLGVDPLSEEFTNTYCYKLLEKHKRQLKPLLLDQAVIAGLGNIYVDEALWRACIHPKRLSHSLSKKEARALRNAIRYVLRTAIKNRGTSLGVGKGNFTSVEKEYGSNKIFLRAYQQTSKPCQRCKTPIERITVAQRGTHICPRCQKR